MKKEDIINFLKWLNKQQRLKINFYLVFSFLLFIPVQNYYAQLNLEKGEPLLRETDLSIEEFSAYPVKNSQESIPNLTAQAIFVTDPQSKAVIYAKNPDQKIFPASTTKIMTGLVVLEEYQLDEVIEVEQVYDVGMVMGLKKGEKLTVESLLKGMLIGSANDAAMVLARHHSEGLAGFIKQMNKKAEELNLDNTHFTNPVGIDQYNHQTTAHDLVILTYEAIENPVFKRIVGVEETVVENLNGEDPALEIEADKVYNLENINELIGEVEGLKGVKTGWTSSAGECLISWTERDGNSILMALFGSQDRFGETEILTEWIFNNYQWEEADFD